MHERERDRELRVEQPFDGLVDDMRAHQRLIDEPVATEQRIQEIMRMTFEVQNGIVQTRKQNICAVALRTWTRGIRRR